MLLAGSYWGSGGYFLGVWWLLLAVVGVSFTGVHGGACYLTAFLLCISLFYSVLLYNFFIVFYQYF